MHWILVFAHAQHLTLSSLVKIDKNRNDLTNKMKGVRKMMESSILEIIVVSIFFSIAIDLK